MKKIGLLPLIGIIGWFAATTWDDRMQNRRLDALEHRYGITINGMDYFIYPLPTNITETLPIQK